MLAVVKTPRTNMQMRGFIPMPVLRVLRNEFGENLTVTGDKDDKKLEIVLILQNTRNLKTVSLRPIISAPTVKTPD